MARKINFLHMAHTSNNKQLCQAQVQERGTEITREDAEIENQSVGLLKLVFNFQLVESDVFSSRVNRQSLWVEVHQYTWQQSLNISLLRSSNWLVTQLVIIRITKKNIS